jgi:nucleoid-associated protein YgaU
VRRQPSTDLLSRAPRAAAPEDEVVVHRGDSLWSIAARRLGPGASDAEVAAAWPRWYAANRAVIGPDPDLVLPGQRLRVPGGGDDA